MPHFALSKNIPKKGRQHRDLSTSLRFGRDDKGEGGVCKREKMLHGGRFHPLRPALETVTTAFKRICHLDRSVPGFLPR